MRDIDTEQNLAIKDLNAEVLEANVKIDDLRRDITRGNQFNKVFSIIKFLAILFCLNIDLPLLNLKLDQVMPVIEIIQKLNDFNN